MPNSGVGGQLSWTPTIVKKGYGNLSGTVNSFMPKSTTLKTLQLQTCINRKKGSKNTGATKLRRGRRTAAETTIVAGAIETTATMVRPT